MSLRHRLIPRIGILRNCSPGHNDDGAINDFEGWVLVIQWPRFVIEFAFGRRA